MLCSKLHCQEAFDLILFSNKIQVVVQGEQSQERDREREAASVDPLGMGGDVSFIPSTRHPAPRTKHQRERGMMFTVLTKLLVTSAIRSGNPCTRVGSSVQGQ